MLKMLLTNLEPDTNKTSSLLLNWSVIKALADISKQVIFRSRFEYTCLAYCAQQLELQVWTSLVNNEKLC